MMNDPTKPVTRHLASDWMHRAYRYAGIDRQKGGLCIPSAEMGDGAQRLIRCANPPRLGLGRSTNSLCTSRDRYSAAPDRPPEVIQETIAERLSRRGARDSTSCRAVEFGGGAGQDSPDRCAGGLWKAVFISWSTS